jgi:Holliday junction resolvasome RuvABC DNA-binding subunit
VLDLRDKTGEIAGLLGRAPAAPLPSSAEPALGGLERDAVHALLSIGYGEKDARKAVARAAAKAPDADLEALIRAALQS